MVASEHLLYQIGKTHGQNVESEIRNRIPRDSGEEPTFRYILLELYRIAFDTGYDDGYTTLNLRIQNVLRGDCHD